MLNHKYQMISFENFPFLSLFLFFVLSPKSIEYSSFLAFARLNALFFYFFLISHTLPFHCVWYFTIGSIGYIEKQHLHLIGKNEKCMKLLLQMKFLNLLEIHRSCYDICLRIN